MVGERWSMSSPGDEHDLMGQGNKVNLYIVGIYIVLIKYCFIFIFSE